MHLNPIGWGQARSWDGITFCKEVPNRRAWTDDRPSDTFVNKTDPKHP